MAICHRVLLTCIVKGLPNQECRFAGFLKIDTSDTESLWVLMLNMTWVQEEGVRFHEVQRQAWEIPFDYSPSFQEWSSWEHSSFWEIWSWWKPWWQGAQTSAFTLMFPKEGVAFQKCLLCLLGNLSIDSTLQKLGHLFICLSIHLKTLVTRCKVISANVATVLWGIVILGLEQVLLWQLWPCIEAAGCCGGSNTFWLKWVILKPKSPQLSLE